MHESTVFESNLHMTDKFHLSVEWKLAVDAALKKQHLRKQDLAALAKCSPGAVSRILDPRSKATVSSKVAQRISEILDVPMLDDRKEVSKELNQLIADLDELKAKNPKDHERLMSIMKVYFDRNK